MLRYVYILFWERVGKGCYSIRIFWACMQALNTVDLSFDLLGLFVMVHLIDIGLAMPIVRIFVIWQFDSVYDDG